MLNTDICQKARLSRDPRFDGKFFTAVKTTGIYCRTICPVYPPKEENVSYFGSAIEAASAGYRPCLRCRPDSAPGSPAWKGVNTTLDRALTLIDGGALQEGSLQLLAERLGISDRYLRKLFKTHLGTSPKSYALYQQCLFAKQLLHQTTWPITQVALASGFSSIRRFNDCFVSQLNLTPSQLRKSKATSSNVLQLKLYYRPPYNWAFMRDFFKTRAIENLEWVDENSYGRTFVWPSPSSNVTGRFTARHIESAHRFDVTIELTDVKHLKAVVNNIRRILDLDVDIQAVEQDFEKCFGGQFPIKTGVRLPGIWSMFEAGIRAVLGQQISVVAAHNLVSTLVAQLGTRLGDKVKEKSVGEMAQSAEQPGDPIIAKQLFPTPAAIANSDLSFLKIPGSRKQTLRNLAQHYVQHERYVAMPRLAKNDNAGHPNPNDPLQWLKLKGIGPWTVDYAQLRGLSEPDIFLGGDLGVKKALGKSVHHVNPEQVSPWQSYLTFQLWSQL